MPLHFNGTEELGSVCVCSEVVVEHLGYRQYICPPAVVCYWPVSFMPHAASFVSLHLGPRLSDPTVLCWAPYHPDPGFGQHRVVEIIHICSERQPCSQAQGIGMGLSEIIQPSETVNNPAILPL